VSESEVGREAAERHTGDTACRAWATGPTPLESSRSSRRHQANRAGHSEREGYTAVRALCHRRSHGAAVHCSSIAAYIAARLAATVLPAAREGTEAYRAYAVSIQPNAGLAFVLTSGSALQGKEVRIESCLQDRARRYTPLRARAWGTRRGTLVGRERGPCWLYGIGPFPGGASGNHTLHMEVRGCLPRD
jgi:hypothetical protein